MIVDFHQHLLLAEGWVDRMLETMDQVGIARSIIHPLGELNIQILGSVIGDNESVFKVVEEHPDRLLASVYLDPLQKDVVEVLSRYHDRGAVCVKIHPTVGYYPDDRICFPLYEEIEKRGLAILSHTGITNIPYTAGTGKVTQSKYAMPIYFDGPARMFPGIRFVLAHMGWPYFREALALAKFNSNIYLDLAGPLTIDEGLALHEREGFGWEIPDEPDLWEKIIWGSDGMDVADSARKLDKYLEKIGRSEIKKKVFAETAKKVLDDKDLF